MGRKVNIKNERPPSLAEISAMNLKDSDWVNEKIAAGIRQCTRVTMRRHRRLGIGPAYSQDPTTGSMVRYKVGDLRADFEKNRVTFDKLPPESQRIINNIKAQSVHDRMLVEKGNEPDDISDYEVDETEA